MLLLLLLLLLLQVLMVVAAAAVVVVVMVVVVVVREGQRSSVRGWTASYLEDNLARKLRRRARLEAHKDILYLGLR